MNGQVSELDAFRRLQTPPGSVAAGRIFTDSEDTMELAREWITDCISRHNLCSRPLRPFLSPTWIIDLESLQEPGTIRVRLTDMSDVKMK